MSKTNIKQPDLLQVFDKFVDREYYKIVGGVIFSSEILVRKERITEEKVWRIKCDEKPDELYINGEQYILNKLSNK